MRLSLEEQFKVGIKATLILDSRLCGSRRSPRDVVYSLTLFMHGKSSDQLKLNWYIVRLKKYGLQKYPGLWPIIMGHGNLPWCWRKGDRRNAWSVGLPLKSSLYKQKSRLDATLLSYPGFPYSARGMMRLKMLVVAFEARFVCLQNE